MQKVIFKIGGNVKCLSNSLNWSLKFSKDLKQKYLEIMKIHYLFLLNFILFVYSSFGLS